MRAVDTNLVVRLIATDDPAQLAATETFIQPGAWVSHLVLMESLWVLGNGHGLSHAALANCVEFLLKHDRLSVQDAGTVKDALVLYRKQPSLGFADCLILEAARHAGHVPLGTFDRKLGKVPGAQKLGGRA
jgi:predicted nucleic-acid-binding protein